MEFRPSFFLPLLLATRMFAADGGPLPDGLYAEFTSLRGEIVTELFYRQAPLTVANFVGLAEGTLGPKTNGQPYYTGLTWYRVVPGFVIQSGNPKAPEDGDTGCSFPDEFVPGLHLGAAGILAMANAGPDTNSGEFFLTLGDCTRLNYMHTVFGHVVRGLGILPQIKPDDPFSIKILRVGAAAESFKADGATFAALLAQTVKYQGAAAPGPTAHFDDPGHVLPTAVPRAQNFNFKLANFQRATGRKIYGRVYPTFLPGDVKETPALFAQKLARALGIHRDGVLAVYFADQDQWQVWIGDDLLPAFNPEKLRVTATKDELYRAVKAQAAAYTAQARLAGGAGRPPTPADLAKYSVDAMLDALILRLEPQPKN